VTATSDWLAGILGLALTVAVIAVAAAPL